MSRVTTTHWDIDEMHAYIESLKSPAMRRNEARLTDRVIRQQLRMRASTADIAETFGVSIGFVNERKRAMGYRITNLLYAKTTKGGGEKVGTSTKEGE